MYRIRLENLDELREGKTVLYLSRLTHYARTYLNSIFTGKILIEEETAKKILIPILEESRKLNNKLEKEGIKAMINYFFEKI